jgi:ribonuclease HI
MLNSLLGRRNLVIYSDSTLVVGQAKGTMKVRHPVLKQVIKQTHELILMFDEIALNYIEREFNTAADQFSKEAVIMDGDYKYVYSLTEVVSAIRLS